MPVINKSKGRIGKFIKYTIFATNILAILLLLLSILSWTVVPSKITVIAYLGLAFPITLFINVAYLIFWTVCLRWKYALVELIVIACCWLPISTCFPMHSKTKEKDIPAKSFKVLSYNVRGFNWLTGKKALENPIFDYVMKTDADIVCFEEFVVAKKKGKDNIISEEELNQILKNYPYRSIIATGKQRGSYIYGLACYSKFPILKSYRIPIESSFNGSVMHTLEIQKRKVSLIINHLNRMGLRPKIK